MANLGKCLLFYLKYPIEMERLYEAKKPNFNELENPDQVKLKIKAVGDAASVEAAEFLELCVPPVVNRFDKISTVTRKRSNLNLTWALEFRVAPPQTPEHWFGIGVGFSTEQSAIIPWVWCRGSRRAAEGAREILGCGELASKYAGWTNRAVALSEIKIPIPEQFDEPIECDSLVEQVEQAFAPFTAQRVEAIAAIANKQDDD